MWREAVGRPLDDSIATVLRSPKPYSSSDSTGVGSAQPVLHMPEPCGNLARDSRTRLGMSGPEMCTSILGAAGFFRPIHRAVRMTQQLIPVAAVFWEHHESDTASEHNAMVLDL